MSDPRPNKVPPTSTRPQDQAGNTMKEGQTTVRPSPGQVTPPVSLDQFTDRLLQSGLIPAADFQAVKQRLQPFTLDSLLTDLVSSKKFTRFQIDAILGGNTPALFVGDYLILDKIGAGGMGQVFRALHRTMDREVALKVLLSPVAPSTDTVQRFLREVQAVAKLSHPNIVTAHDAGEQGGKPYLAMEYIQGTDLNGYVKRRGPLPLAEAVDLTLQTARGLHYAHSQGVVHRDIKPSNLLRSAEGVVKILDLGLAKVKGDATVTAAGVAMGTPDYLSPEQGLDAAAVDHRTDIYSLGCTLHFLLSGKPVYPGDSLVKIIMAHQQSPIPSLRKARPDVPEQLDAVFRKMVTKKPEDRYQSMTEVMADLSSVGKGAVARPGGRKGVRMTGVLVAIVLVIGALVAAGAVLLWTPPIWTPPTDPTLPTMITTLSSMTGSTKPTNPSPTKPDTKPMPLHPDLTGKWAGHFTAGGFKGKKTSMELAETKDGRFIGTWTDRTGTSPMKGVRTNTKMTFSVSYQLPKLGPTTCDVEGEIEDGGKTLKIKFTESWKELGKPKTDTGEAILKRE